MHPYVADPTFRRVFEAVDHAMCVLERLPRREDGRRDYRFVAMNPAMQRLFAIDDLTGRSVRDCFPDEVEAWYDDYDRVFDSGEPMRIERRSDPQDMVLEMSVNRIEEGVERRLLLVIRDVSERWQAERALRESEDRQAYLLALSDTLRPIEDDDLARDEAMRLLGEHLRADRAEYFEIEPTGRFAAAHGTYAAGLPPSPDPVELARYGSRPGEAYAIGRTFVIDDIDTLGLDESQLAAWMDSGARAVIAAPLLKDGRLCALLAVSHHVPRTWTRAEVTIVEETAERTWAAVDRARSEAAYRGSEARFRQFADASSDALWIRDAQTLHLEYASNAMGAIYGVPYETLVAEPRLCVGLVVPEDRDEVMQAFDRVRQGESIAHEFRIRRPADNTFRWIRAVGFPLSANGDGISRIAGISSDVTDARLAAEHQGVLLAELQHRVRNILAIIRSVVARTAHDGVSARDYADDLTGRLVTLARVQALLTTSTDAKVPLQAIIADELQAQAAHSGQFEIAGPGVVLAPKAAEAMTLVVHELATNAIKHGALSTIAGRVRARWSVDDRAGTPWLSFDWRETGAPPRMADAPRRGGFGRELVEGRIPYELGGTGVLEIGAEGAHCRLEFPLRRGSSVLETHAPRLATVFGGAIDMGGERRLELYRVLVVEDDYFLAADIAGALAGAGASIAGPFATAREALAMPQDPGLHAAVLDIDLRDGRSFDLARECVRAGVRCVFVTGYDEVAVPTDLAHLPRLQKPVDYRELVRCVAGELRLRA